MRQRRDRISVILMYGLVGVLCVAAAWLVAHAA
jgi:hypothetical protein